MPRVGLCTSSSAFEAKSDEPSRYQARIHRRSRSGPVDPLRYHHPSRRHHWRGLRVAAAVKFCLFVGIGIDIGIGIGICLVGEWYAVFYARLVSQLCTPVAIYRPF